MGPVLLYVVVEHYGVGRGVGVVKDKLARRSVLEVLAPPGPVVSEGQGRPATALARTDEAVDVLSYVPTPVAHPYVSHKREPRCDSVKEGAIAKRQSNGPIPRGSRTSGIPRP